VARVPQIFARRTRNPSNPSRHQIRAIHHRLGPLKGKEMEFVTELVVTTKCVVNRVKVNQLDASQRSEVLVVNEFPDVFP
jgi:hypothetical protein